MSSPALRAPRILAGQSLLRASIERTRQRQQQLAHRHIAAHLGTLDPKTPARWWREQEDRVLAVLQALAQGHIA